MTVAALAYSNTLEGPFVFDDTPNIVENPLIKSLHYFADTHAVESSGVDRETKTFFISRRFGYLTLAANYKLGGLDVTGYHLFRTWA